MLKLRQIFFKEDPACSGSGGYTSIWVDVIGGYGSPLIVKFSFDSWFSGSFSYYHWNFIALNSMYVTMHRVIHSYSRLDDTAEGCQQSFSRKCALVAHKSASFCRMWWYTRRRVARDRMRFGVAKSANLCLLIRSVSAILVIAFIKNDVLVNFRKP